VDTIIASLFSQLSPKSRSTPGGRRRKDTHGATRWQIYDWRRRFRRERLEAPSAEIAAAPAFVPLTVDEAMPEPGADFIEVAIGDVLIRVGHGVSEAHLARIFRAVRAAT
jgi:transposase